ncbi:hypothetical protein [Bryobacter aggregatus]|uniref:hypothetical protein n=1 Tax=Bryobacter aggregatus TaxID=360054 RepID=UPI0004E1E31A|nr:hypothetical protein [Bryobacter aggregatus]
MLAYYLWASTAFNEFSPNGYYNYLARGFASGHLYVPIEVNPKLLELENPYDPEVPDELRMSDMALYEGRYYLYHGPAPVLLTFLPIHRLFHRDLPENLALFLFACAGFLANLMTLRKFHPDAGSLLYLGLGLANGIPFLLHRAMVYEVAIGCGYACLAVGFALYFRGKHALAGIAFAFAILSRPHLGLALLFVSPRCWPTASLGVLASLSYNYLRFHWPFEFGLHYLLAGPGQQSPNFRGEAIFPSLYMFLLHPPEWLAKFPFLRITRDPAIALPPQFFHENIMGALWLAPFLVLQRPKWRLAATGAALLLFLSSAGWVTQRYVVDFLPWMVLAALCQKANPRLRNPLIAMAVVMNLLLHWQGPYNAP